VLLAAPRALLNAKLILIPLIVSYVAEEGSGELLLSQNTDSGKPVQKNLATHLRIMRIRA